MAISACARGRLPFPTDAPQRRTGSGLVCGGLLILHASLCCGLPQHCTPRWRASRRPGPSSSARRLPHRHRGPLPFSTRPSPLSPNVAAGLASAPLLLLRGGGDGGVAARLGTRELALAALPVLLAAGLARALRLRALSRSVVVSSLRLSVQLLLFGGALLQYLFRVTSPLPVLLWIVLAGIVAAREAAARVPHVYRRMGRDGAAATFAGVGAALLYVRACVLPPRDGAEPFWSGRAVVPLAGILYGNAAARTGACLTTLLAELADGRDRIELRLARGATAWEAARPAVRDGVGAAMAPTLTQMAATGLVAMPGMMTGAILSGQDPAQAAAYQIAIFFSICASSCASSLIVAWLVLGRTFDAAAARLLPPEKSTLRRRGERTKATPKNASNTTEPPRTSMLLVQNEPRGPETDIVLRIDGLTVRRTGLTASFDLARGERLGIVGRSGIGKSQLLRAIVGIEAAAGGTTTLLSREADLRPDDGLVCRWRSRVAWVSQDRPTLPGTPREFFREALSYRVRRRPPGAGEAAAAAAATDPARFCDAWSLPPEALDRPWQALSGGEAQRAALAVALATRPEVLLLDEPTSACDAATTMAIEATLKELGIPLLMVSHSEEQVRRFCTGVLSLDETVK